MGFVTDCCSLRAATHSGITTRAGYPATIRPSPIPRQSLSDDTANKPTCRAVAAEESAQQTDRRPSLSQGGCRVQGVNKICKTTKGIALGIISIHK